jgi:hypothetical protein
VRFAHDGDDGDAAGAADGLSRHQRLQPLTPLTGDAGDDVDELGGAGESVGGSAVEAQLAHVDGLALLIAPNEFTHHVVARLDQQHTVVGRGGSSGHGDRGRGGWRRGDVEEKRSAVTHRS